ncbi:MAG: hypothetical protein ACOC6C_06555 [Verrucomicrobiota bacterium]
MREKSAKLSEAKKRNEGSVVFAVILLFVGCALVGSYLRFSSHDARLSRMTLDHQKAVIVAEAGLDYGVMKLRDIVLNYQLSPLISSNNLQNMIDAVAVPPSIGDYAFQTPDGQSAFRIQIESPVISGTITNGTACRGSVGNYQYFTVTCGAINTNSGKGAVLKQTVQAVGLYLIRFGVFYEEDLEIIPGPRMDFYGPVHANADIYLSANNGPLNFWDRVTAHGNIYHKRKDDGQPYGDTRIIDSSSNLVSMDLGGGDFLDSEHSDWVSQSLSRWDGKILSADHGTVRLSPPIDPLDQPHDIIERPLSTNNPTYKKATEDEKFSNKACLKLHVDSNGVMNATDYYGNDVSGYLSNAVLEIASTNSDSGVVEYRKNSDGSYRMVTSGSYDVSQTNFYDQRERCYMAPVDLYIGNLLEDFPEIYDGTYLKEEGKGIVYVTRDDPDGLSNGVVPCVRLRNGGTVQPNEGLSVVSDLPVYVEGNYNTNTTKPALVAGDAVSFLSSGWQDAKSVLDLNDRRGADTKYNTVIMTGNSETTWGNYNGGLENVLRFLESWSGKTAQYRGSIIDLWHSEIAKGEWIYGSPVYTAPRRDWGYDSIYRSLSPPGMTRVFGMEEIQWERTTFDREF